MILQRFGKFSGKDITQGSVKISQSLDGPFDANNLWAGYMEVAPGFSWVLRAGLKNADSNSEMGVHFFFDGNLADGQHSFGLGQSGSKTNGHYFQIIDKEGGDWLYAYPPESGSISLNFNQAKQTMEGAFKFIVKDLNDEDKNIEGVFEIKGFEQIPL